MGRTALNVLPCFPIMQNNQTWTRESYFPTLAPQYLPARNVPPPFTPPLSAFLVPSTCYVARNGPPAVWPSATASRSGKGTLRPTSTDTDMAYGQAATLAHPGEMRLARTPRSSSESTLEGLLSPNIELPKGLYHPLGLPRLRARQVLPSDPTHEEGKKATPATDVSARIGLPSSCLPGQFQTALKLQGEASASIHSSACSYRRHRIPHLIRANDKTEVEKGSRND